MSKYFATDGNWDILRAHKDINFLDSSSVRIAVDLAVGGAICSSRENGQVIFMRSRNESVRGDAVIMKDWFCAVETGRGLGLMFRERSEGVQGRLGADGGWRHFEFRGVEIPQVIDRMDVMSMCVLLISALPRDAEL